MDPPGQDEEIRSRLDELREKLAQRSVRDWRSSRSSAGRESNADALMDVDRAIRMLDAGTYGLCEACGRPIPPERLDAYPAARFCLEDQQNHER
jgi:RNA polymerase-binding transcription factor DksA